VTDDIDKCSLNSEELFELSQYYEKKANFKNMKEEIKKTKNILKNLPSGSSNLKRLFRKSLEKL
jgi:DNA repair ATPase RecN